MFVDRLLFLDFLSDVLLVLLLKVTLTTNLLVGWGDNLSRYSLCNMTYHVSFPLFKDVPDHVFEDYYSKMFLLLAQTTLSTNLLPKQMAKELAMLLCKGLFTICLFLAGICPYKLGLSVPCEAEVQSAEHQIHLFSAS